MELTYHLLIRTRSTDRDYFWIGNAPEEWWLKWGDSKLRRRPSLLRDASSGGDRLFLTGIVSGRRDGSGSRTPIRYEIAAARSSDGSGISNAHLDGLVEAWWQQRLTPPNSEWPLGLAIDDALAREAPGERTSVDALLEARDDVVVAAAMRHLPAVTVRQNLAADLSDARWIGADHPDVRAYVLEPRSLAYFGAVSATEAEIDLGLPPGVLLVVDGDDAIHARRGTLPASAKKARAAGTPHRLNPYQVRLWTIVGLFLLLLLVALLLIL